MARPFKIVRETAKKKKVPSSLPVRERFVASELSTRVGRVKAVLTTASLSGLEKRKEGFTAPELAKAFIAYEALENERKPPHDVEKVERFFTPVLEMLVRTGEARLDSTGHYHLNARP